MTNQRKRNIAIEVANKLRQAQAIDKLKNAYKGVDSMYNSLTTPQTLRGVTANNIMQPTQNALTKTPTINNLTTSTAPTIATPSSVGLNGTGTTALTSGLGDAGLGTFGTAAASEAGGAGGMELASLGNIGANVAATAGGEALSGAGTGAGAALGGSTAAGAAGGAAGAGVGSAILGALGPVGALAGLGMTIWNMIDGARKEKQMKAMKMAQEEGQRSEQAANETTNAAMQNLQQGAEKNRQQMLETVNNQGVLGQLPSILYTSDSTEPNVPDYQPEQYIMPNNVTGGANSEGLVEQMPNTQVGGVEQLDDNRKLKDHLMSFFNNVGSGFNENNSTTINPANFFDNTYTTKEVTQLPMDERVSAFADKLNQDGIEEKIIDTYLNEGKNSGNKEIANFIDSHRDLMDENGKWKPVNKVIEKENKKGVGYRVGEALGTINRIASHPATQGLITTGAYMLDGETPWYSLGKGYEMASNKARSDAYRRMITRDNSASLFGGYSDKDLNAYTNQLYRDRMAGASEQRANNDTRRVEGQVNRWDTQNKNDTTRTQGQVNRWNSQNKIDQQNANTRSGMLGVAQQRLQLAKQREADKKANGTWIAPEKREGYAKWKVALSKARTAYKNGQLTEDEYYSALGEFADKFDQLPKGYEF